MKFVTRKISKKLKRSEGLNPNAYTFRESFTLDVKTLLWGLDWNQPQGIMYDWFWITKGNHSTGIRTQCHFSTVQYWEALCSYTRAGLQFQLWWTHCFALFRWEVLSSLVMDYHSVHLECGVCVLQRSDLGFEFNLSVLWSFLPNTVNLIFTLT